MALHYRQLQNDLRSGVRVPLVSPVQSWANSAANYCALVDCGHEVERGSDAEAPGPRMSPPRPTPSPVKAIPPTISPASPWDTRAPLRTSYVTGEETKFQNISGCKPSSGPSMKLDVKRAPAPRPGHKTAMQWVQYEDAKFKSSFKRSSSPFRSTSARFGYPSPARSRPVPPVSYDSSCYVRPLPSSAHDFYVPPGIASPRRTVTSPMRSRTPRFAPCVVHGTGMLSPLLK